MTKLKRHDANFKAALEIYSQQMAEQITLTEDDKQYTFSDGFETRMQNLIRKERKLYRRMVSTTARRVACIVLAILTISASLMSIESVRNSVIKLVFDTVDEFFLVRVYTDKNPVKEIESRYEPSFYLDGFDKEILWDGWASYGVRFTNGDKYITFMQNVTIGNTHLDMEGVTSLAETRINDLDAKTFLYKGYEHNIVWSDGDYIFLLSGNVDGEILLKIAESVS